MKIYKCPDCGNEISEGSIKPVECPICGCPFEKFEMIEIIDEPQPRKFCPKCGSVLPSPEAKFCPNCGYPSTALPDRVTANNKSTKRLNVSPKLESSNNFNAEHVINAFAIVNLCVGILIGIIGLIVGITLITEGGFGMETPGILCIVGGLLFFFISILFWALLKLLVNMSYRLTRLDNKYNPQ